MNKTLKLLVVLAAAAVLAGCAGNSHNSADVNFARNMIPHHAQAVQMSELAPAGAQSEAVKTLATRIKNAQQPEIDQMNSWLRDWDEPEVDAEAAMQEHMGHAGHSMAGMEGMLSQDQMDALEAAKGAEFDKLFLQGMISHHEGAIAMARSVEKDGKSDDTKELAKSIISSQQSEIDEMNRLLGQYS